MKQRSPLAVFFLPFVTFGIYSLVWEVKTKNEMKLLGADIPTAWLLLVPFVSYYWLWKYCVGAEKTTNNGISTVMTFVLLFLLGNIGMAIIQNEFNKLGASPMLASAPSAPSAWQPPAANDGTVGSPYVSQIQPDNSFGGPITPASPAVSTLSPVAPDVYASSAPTTVIAPAAFTASSPAVVVPEQPATASQPVYAVPTYPGQPSDSLPQTPPQA